MSRAQAVDRARSVEGLTVDETGTVVSIDGDGRAVLAELIDAYLEASGDLAAFMIARRFENMPESDLPLPDPIEKHI